MADGRRARNGASRTLVERILPERGLEGPHAACHDFLRRLGHELGAGCLGLLRSDPASSALRCLSHWSVGETMPDESCTGGDSPIASAVRRALDAWEPVRLGPTHQPATRDITVAALPVGSRAEPGVLLALARPDGRLDPAILNELPGVAGLAELHFRALVLASRLERQEVLGRCARDLSTRIASGVSDLELLDFFSRFAGETFGTDMVLIYTGDEDGSWLHLQSMHDSRTGVLHGGYESGLFLADGTALASDIAAGRIVEFEDLDTAELPEAWREMTTRARIRALLAVPMPGTDGRPGLVVLAREDTGRVLLPEDRALFQGLVRQTAPLLENVRMVRDLRHNLDSLGQLLDTSREVSSQLDLAEVPRLLARRAMEMTAADEGMILLVEPDGRTLKPVLALSEYESEMMQVRATIGEGISGHVAQTRIGEIVNHGELDPRSRHIPGTPVEPEAILCVPLVCADDLLGVMTLYKLGGRSFNDTDLAMINIFATQAAIALENATLFQRVVTEQSRLSTMIHQMEEAVFFCDAAGAILVMNSAARGLVKGSGTEGCPLADVAVEGMRDRLERAMTRLVTDGVRNVTEEFRIADRCFLGSFTAIRDDRNAVTGSIVLCKDVTELKSMESQLLESSKMSAVGQLASGVAHEFNNLIAAIYGYAQFMKNNREERVLAKGIDIILSSSERARDLTRSLLTFSRASSDSFEAVDLNEVLSDAILLVEQQIAKEGIRLVRNFGRLPHAWAERGRLIEVFLNVMSNARHAMPDGGTLTLTTREEESQAIVEVSDTGTGIPTEQVGRVFDPFFTTKGPLNGTRTPGTGLGLFTVYNIVQAHGGRVTVESAVEHGTTVRITLPTRRGPVRSDGEEGQRRAG